MDTKVNYCPRCKSIILSSGFCRNRECKLGSKLQISEKQRQQIEQLSEQLNHSVPSDIITYTKAKAKILIDKLTKELVNQQMFGGED